MRLLVLLLPAAVAACSGPAPPPAPTPPLRYDYLTPIRLNVGSIAIEDRSGPPAPNDIGARSPDPPLAALQRMASDRLVAAGGSGARAVFVIHAASLLSQSGAVSGNMDVELDIISGSGNRAGYAEARVARVQPITGSAGPAVAYDMTRAMMESMNVEFEYQVRRSLRDWLAPELGAAPAAVQQQPLAPGAPGAMAAPPASAAPGAPLGLAPPAVPPVLVPQSPPNSVAPFAPQAGPSGLPPPVPLPE